MKGQIKMKRCAKVIRAGDENMKGFVFTIDAMVALLFAFLIISIPLPIYSDNYNSAFTQMNIAVMHQQTHIPPTELLARINMCGAYTLFDEKMQVITKESTCECNTDKYTYIYVDSNGRPYLAELTACRVNI